MPDSRKQSREPRVQPTDSVRYPRPVESSTNDIRPFEVRIPDKALADLLRRIEATRWPTRELVRDRSQGVQLATLQALARYWATDYD